MYYNFAFKTSVYNVSCDNITGFKKSKFILKTQHLYLLLVDSVFIPPKMPAILHLWRSWLRVLILVCARYSWTV